MKRTAGAWVLLAAMSGCMSMEGGPEMASGPRVGCGSGKAREIPGVQGPWGQPVAMAMPYAAGGSPGATAAQAMMARSVPLDLIQNGALPGVGGSGIDLAGAWINPGTPSGVVQASGSCPPGGCPPGAMTGGPGLNPPGVPGAPVPPSGAPAFSFPPGAVAGVGALPPGMPSRFPTKRTEVRFVGPDKMKITWYAPGPDGKPGFTATQPLEAPARYNFPQAAIYRLKLSDIPNRPGVDLYPTLEVVPANGKTCTFLAHSAVPVTFTEEDLEQVASGNYVVKVIYLPDPQYQDLAGAAEEVVSSRLEPGVDPIAEACRRGSILLVIRLGNIDLEAANTPPMDAPAPWCPPPQMPPQPPVPGMPPFGAMGLPGMPTTLPGMPPMPGMPNGPMPGMPGQQPAASPAPPAPTGQTPTATGVTPAGWPGM